MQCEQCDQQAVIGNPSRCRRHFIEEFERRVRQTIDDFNLIPPNAKICVAASGGKDSLTTLFVLKKLGHAVTALIIDEGIAGYREHTLEDLKAFCTQHSVPLKIASYREDIGAPLDEMIKKSDKHPCTICGIFRRYLINKHASGFDVLATGHNADDEAQAVLMNLFKAHPFFAKGGPKTGVRKTGVSAATMTNVRKDLVGAGGRGVAPSGSTVTLVAQDAAPPGFVQRIKPLYFCTEKEIMTYAMLQGVEVGFAECPNITGSYRARVRDVLNDYAIEHPEAKRNVLKKFLTLKAQFKESKTEPVSCSHCGEPAHQTVCAACQMRDELQL